MLTTRTPADKEEKTNPIILSAEVHTLPFQIREYRHIHAISMDTIIYDDIVYNLETKKEERLTQSEQSRFRFGKLYHLPGERLATVCDDISAARKNLNKISIYSSRTRELLKEIRIPLPSRTINVVDTFFQVEKLSLSLDKKVLIIRGSFESIAWKIRVAKKPTTERIPAYDTFFLDLETYHLTFHKHLSEDEEIYWIGNSQYISLAEYETETDDPFESETYKRCQIHSTQAKEIIPCEMTDIENVESIYAFPQHPSFWIVKVYNPQPFPDLYIYNVQKQDGKYVATKSKEIAGCSDTFSAVVPSCNSIIYRNATERLFEFNLQTKETRKIEFEGYHQLNMRCLFPDGRVGFTALNEEGKQQFIVVKLASTLALAKQQEAELMSAMDQTFISADRKQGLAEPLQRLIAGYAGSFFAVDKEEGTCEPSPAPGPLEGLQAHSERRLG